MTLKIVVPGYIPPSVNQLERTHWAKRGRDQNKLKWMVIDALATDNGEYRSLPPEFVRASCPMMVRVRAYRKRHLDQDNAIGGLKPLVDVIKGLGLIHDDSPKWMDLGLEEYIDAANPRTEIEIEPMPATARDKSKRR